MNSKLRIPLCWKEKWLAAQFAANRPWDEIATALITATGRFDENGAVALALAEGSQAVELAGEVSRVFMGVQIQCAQCHDHPSDSWKRQQFHEFAAFFAGLRSRRATPQKTQPVVFEVITAGNARYTMPDLKDPQKSIPVAPKFFLGDAPTVDNRLRPAERRALAASYVTGQDNPWFAKAFVNRVWYALMGEGFYLPIDDMGPERDPNAPEVIEALATQWQQGGYDIRWLFRTILNTRAYQREARSTNTAAGRTPFAANCPSRLRSDQIFDALTQALDISPEALKGQGPQAKKAKAKLTAAIQQKLADQPKAVQAAVKAAALARFGPRLQFNNVFGVDPSTSNDEVLGTIPQALYLMNSPLVTRSIQARPNTVLGGLLAATPDNRAVLDALYLRVLARRPNDKEVLACGRYLESVGDRREAFEDIYWSLINSTEFISRR